MTSYEWASIGLAAITWLTLLITAIILVYHLQQFTKQSQSGATANEIGRLTALLQMEGSISEASLRVSETGLELAKYEDVESPPQPDFKIATLRYQHAKQVYLNAIDRLCSSMLKGHLNEVDLRPDYRSYITDIVRQYPNDFAAGTHYRNIVKMQSMWADT